VRRERNMGRRAIRVGTTTDRFTQRFERGLDPIVQTYALGGSERGSERGSVLVTFSLPGRALTPDTTADGRIFYPIRMRVTASAGPRLAASLDTLRSMLVPRPLVREERLQGAVELPVPPGSYTLQVVITQPSLPAGAAFRRDGVVVPTAAVPVLTLSDIVLGLRTSGLTWPRAGVRVPLNAAGAFPAKTDAELYYEAGGLAPGTAYRTRVEVMDPEGAKRLVGLEFEETAGAGAERYSRTLALSSLKKGRYTLVVRIEGPDGRTSAMRETPLLISGE
jgi:hypothetical protein